MKSRVHLGGNERLILVGHDVAIVVSEEVEAVYFAEDWNNNAAPSMVFGEHGDLRRHNGSRCYGRPVPHREARCPSEQRRFERLFARAFRDELRIG